VKESQDTLLLRTFHSVIVLKIIEKMKEWTEFLRGHIRGTHSPPPPWKHFFFNPPNFSKKFLEGYRYQAFRETRLGVSAKYLVNGEEYFESLVKALNVAKHTIYIAGWYLAPWIYLKRNPVDEESELGKILSRKAAEVGNFFCWIC
jgi:phosphatidylserine/phosphatidylglycerophosphate/cardiolipin synthase-like enzyme